jgi:type IV pilus assembly protein PilA
MKIFCTRCGLPKELENSAAGAFVTCASCGNRFNVGGRAPTSSISTTAVIVIAAVVAVPVVVAIIGILAAIAIPNFIRFQARSKQAECKVNLKALVQYERSYFEQHQAYTPVLSALPFFPERGNRYAYFAGPGPQEHRTGPQVEGTGEDTQVDVDQFRLASSHSITQRDLPQTFAGNVFMGLSGSCPNCALVAVCAGNVDNDPGLDVWSVSTDDRVAPDGSPIPAGVPFNDHNDVTD